LSANHIDVFMYTLLIRALMFILNFVKSFEMFHYHYDRPATTDQTPDTTATYQIRHYHWRNTRWRCSRPGSSNFNYCCYQIHQKTPTVSINDATLYSNFYCFLYSILYLVYKDGYLSFLKHQSMSFNPNLSCVDCYEALLWTI